MSSFNLTNKVLFPAPSPAHYTVNTFPQHLIWIPPTSVTPSIPCLYLQYGSACELFVIFSHGNGCDIGSMYQQLLHYHHFWKAHILAYEYPGYGCCDGEPGEPAINHQIEEVYRFVTEVMKWPPERIVFYGHSIGTGPTTRIVSHLLQQKRGVGGMILQSPYLSICDIAKSHVGMFGNLLSNRWNNLEEIKSVTTPVLLLHGCKDTLIPSKHSEGLYAACPSKSKHIVLIDYADHNYFEPRDLITPTVQFFEKYWPRKKPSPPAAAAAAGLGDHKDSKDEPATPDSKVDSKADSKVDAKSASLVLPEINLDAKYWDKPKTPAPPPPAPGLLSGLFAWSVASINSMSGQPVASPKVVVHEPRASGKPKAPPTPAAGDRKDVKNGDAVPAGGAVVAVIVPSVDPDLSGSASSVSASGVRITTEPVFVPASKQSRAALIPGGPAAY